MQSLPALWASNQNRMLKAHSNWNAICDNPAYESRGLEYLEYSRDQRSEHAPKYPKLKLGLRKDVRIIIESCRALWLGPWFIMVHMLLVAEGIVVATKPLGWHQWLNPSIFKLELWNIVNCFTFSTFQFESLWLFWVFWLAWSLFFNSASSLSRKSRIHIRNSWQWRVHCGFIELIGRPRFTILQPQWRSWCQMGCIHLNWHQVQPIDLKRRFLDNQMLLNKRTKVTSWITISCPNGCSTVSKHS